MSKIDKLLPRIKKKYIVFLNVCHVCIYFGVTNPYILIIVTNMRISVKKSQDKKRQNKIRLS